MNIGFEFISQGRQGHKYIQTSNKPLNGIVTEAALLVTNQYLQAQAQSAKKWRKEKRAWNVNYEFPAGQKCSSKPINYLIISKSIMEKGYFEPNEFNLPPLQCVWLDHSTEMKLDFHVHDQTGAILAVQSGDLQAHYYGENYPIKPSLKREGHLYTSFQPQLIKNIIKGRSEIIENSDKSLTDDWIFDLRNLINNSISLFDVAFAQLYIKAEYQPLPGWTFNKEKLGDRIGKRLNDKFKWIYQITGNTIDFEAERESFENLRALRNHFMHFDPPSLLITLEEAAIWLNQIIDIGKILIKIRQAIKVDVSTELINFILQKEAKFLLKMVKENH